MNQVIASRGRGSSRELAGQTLIAAFPLRGALGSLLPKLLAGVAFTALSLTLTVLPAAAAAPAPPGSTGYDISWPQCSSSFPAGGAFGIVGVTNGLAFSANPCLRNEFAWALGRPYAAGLYMNTGNPETASSNWPGRAGVGPRTCSTANLSDPSNVDCAYNYGWNAATDALKVATANVGTAARTLPWWLDVEIGNSWNGTAAANSSTVQGYIDYVRSQATSTVGIYSTGYQWGQITAGYTVPSSPSNPAAPDWLAGASSVSQAAGMCDPANSFSGGPIQLVQYPNGGFDGNYVCGSPPPPPTPDFSVVATPSSQTVVQGAGTSYTVNITRTGGFTGAVTLSSSVQPSNTTIGVSFSNPNPTTGNTSTMSVTTGSTTPTASYTLTITGTAGSTPTHTATVAMTVQAAPTPDFSVTATPSSQTVIPGAGTSYTVNITRTGGFTGAVTLSSSVQPTSTTIGVSFSNPNPVTGNTSTMSVTTGSTTPTGSYTLTITGTATGTPTHTTAVALMVQAAQAGDYSLSATPSSRSITRGTSANYTVTIARTGGFTGAVTFSLSGLPSGTTFSFSPNPSTGAGTATNLRVRTGQATPAGTYLLTITGVSGSLTRAITVTLVVTASIDCNNC
jgi:hypothetical protein